VRPASANFLDALREPHVLYTRVVSTAPDTTVTELPVVEGAVTLDATVETRARVELSVASPVAPRRTDGPLTPYGAWLDVYRGVRFADGSTEAIRLGRFRIDSVDTDLAAGTVRVAGYDASVAMRDDKFLAPRTVVAGTTFAAAITALAQETIPGLAIELPAGASAAIATDMSFELERWQAIRELATAIGCEAYIDGDRKLIVRVPPPTASAPVWAVNAGPGGVLTAVAESLTREAAYNAVVATGEALDGDPPVRGVAYDTTSPIAWGGPFGHNPRFYSSPLLQTDAQALAAAQSILATGVGTQRAVDFSAVPNPALEPGDPITLTYPDGHTETHIIDTLTIPLRATGAMSARTRMTSAVAAEVHAGEQLAEVA